MEGPHYLNWNSAAVITHEWSRWALVNVVADKINKLEGSVYCLGTSTKEGIAILDNISGTNIVGPKTRFPETGSYINIDDPAFTSAVAKMKTSLFHRGRSSCTTGVKAESGAPSYNETITGFFTAHNEAKTYILSSNKIWTRKRYEFQFKLSW